MTNLEIKIEEHLMEAECGAIAKASRLAASRRQKKPASFPRRSLAAALSGIDYCRV